MERHDIKVLGCLSENSVGRASAAWATLCGTDFGDLPLREGVPLEDVGDEADCIIEQECKRGKYRLPVGVNVSGKPGYLTLLDCVGAGIEIEHRVIVCEG